MNTNKINGRVKNTAAIIGGIGLGIGAGAALMYLLDPDRGEIRRSNIRDKAVGTGNDIKNAVIETSHDIRDKAQTLLHEAGTFVANVSEDAEQSGRSVIKKVAKAANV